MWIQVFVVALKLAITYQRIPTTNNCINEMKGTPLAKIKKLSWNFFKVKLVQKNPGQNKANNSLVKFSKQ